MTSENSVEGSVDLNLPLIKRVSYIEDSAAKSRAADAHKESTTIDDEEDTARDSEERVGSASGKMICFPIQRTYQRETTRRVVVKLENGL
jgi:hypothetical protein